MNGPLFLLFCETEDAATSSSVLSLFAIPLLLLLAGDFSSMPSQDSFLA